jgi:cytochrome c oxidase subunit 4
MSDPHATPSTAPATSENKHGVIGDVDSPATLFVVFLGVIGLFFANFTLSSQGVGGQYMLFIQLAIASVQAGLVAYYFMHLRQGDRVVTLTALASIFWVGILFVLFMADYMSRHRVVTG